MLVLLLADKSAKGTASSKLLSRSFRNITKSAQSWRFQVQRNSAHWYQHDIFSEDHFHLRLKCLPSFSMKGSFLCKNLAIGSTNTARPLSRM